MNKERIPEAVIRRLPKYFRYLKEMEERGAVRVSSSKMSRDLGFNASQIRRDLNCFGGFGQQGYGYSVPKLRSEIARIMGLNREHTVAVIGAGNIGQALVSYDRFAREGFKVAAIFDVAPGRIGQEAGGQRIRPLSELEDFVKKTPVEIGVICTPQSAAQDTADLLVRLGFRGIWNFAPIDVQVPAGVSLENVHLNDSLYVLAYRLRAESREIL